jgi:hypothetical protein
MVRIIVFLGKGIKNYSLRNFLFLKHRFCCCVSTGMKLSAITTVVMAIFAISVSLNILIFVQYQNVLQAYGQLLSEHDQPEQLYVELNKTADELSIKAYVLGEAVVVSSDPLFSPPTSMYRAIRIALDNHGWNATSLKGMVVGAYLCYMHFWNATASAGFEVLREVTEPVADYSPVQNETGTYRYIWQVVVCRPDIPSIPPPDLCFIDASSSEIIPTGHLL